MWFGQLDAAVLNSAVHFFLLSLTTRNLVGVQSSPGFITSQDRIYQVACEC